MRILNTATGGADAGKVYCEIRSSPADGYGTTSAITVDDGELHHIVWRQSSTTSGVVFVDGSATGSTGGLVGTPGIPNDLSSGYAIGNSPASVFGDFKFAVSDIDLLDEVVIWDGLNMAVGRVTAHYEAGSGAWEGETPKDRINHI